MSLIDATERNDTKAMKFVMLGGAELDGVNAEGSTSLFLAAHEGFLECARELLDAKADVNKANYSTYTPLHVASSQGHVECVRVRMLCH